MADVWVDTPLLTGRWQDVAKTVEVRAFTPVRISLGLPRFFPNGRYFAYVEELAPVGLFRVNDRVEFTERYRARLDSFGVEHIGGRLSEVWAVEEKPLVLLCYEKVVDGSNWCHRQVFAEWWQERTGVVVPEVIGYSEDDLVRSLRGAE